MPRVSRDGLQGLGGGLEQEGVNHRLVVLGEITDWRVQGKHQVIILARQQVDLARFEPTMRGPIGLLRRSIAEFTPGFGYRVRFNFTYR